MSYMGKVRPTIALTSADIEDGAILNVDVNASAAIANSKMATDTTNATNLATGTVPTARLGSGSASSSTFLTGAQTYAAVDTSGITANQDDIALLGFKVAANGSLARYNLVDQSIDAFEDASGVDASGSTNEIRTSSNYYTGRDGPIVTGGTVTTDGSDTIHTFLLAQTGTDYVSDTTQNVEYLVVAGAGGGGAGASEGGAGGGGAGGYISNYGGVALSLAAATYTVTVGDGGAGGVTAADGGDGLNSVFSSFTALAGGGGGRRGIAGRSGASSGGSGARENTRTASSDAAQGSAGGSGQPTSSGWDAGAGGGGKNEVGQDAQSGSHAGDGGNGLANAITGASVTYSGGGGGSVHSGTDFGAGGTGGGGRGGDGSAVAVAGTDGLGGGGGAGGADLIGRDGGSGVVIIRRPTATTYNDMTLISNAQTANDGAPDNADLVITYTDGAGTATINTDLKAYVSRDGSAYSSAVTLVSQGTTGGHTILTANGIDISGITSGTSMRWKIETLNQSAAKETRIQAVSLGWS